MSVAVRTTAVAEVLEKALDGARISDEEALTLLRSRDPVSVGRVANELRDRKTDPDRVTFIIDRNLNYSTSAPSTGAPATRARATCCRSR